MLRGTGKINPVFSIFFSTCNKIQKPDLVLAYIHDAIPIILDRTIHCERASSKNISTLCTLNNGSKYIKSAKYPIEKKPA